MIGNQKGGAGKSTLTLLLANYLVTVRKRSVTVLDLDYQQSLSSKAEKAKILENEPLYEVLPAGLEHFPSLLELLRKDPRQLVLVDLPGKMDDDGLIPVFEAAALVLCPFAYDEFSVDSTLLFSLVVRKINFTVPIVYIPNRVKGSVKYDTKSEVESALGQFGQVTLPLYDRIDFQRATTFHIPLTIAPVIIPVFDSIYRQHIFKKIDA